HVDELARLEVQAFRGRGAVRSAGVRPQKLPADSPEQPDANPTGHLQRAAIAGTNVTEALAESFPPTQVVGRFQQFAGLAKVGRGPGGSLESRPQPIDAAGVGA